MTIVRMCPYVEMCVCVLGAGRQLYMEIRDIMKEGQCRPWVVRRLVVERGANGAGHDEGMVRLSPLVFVLFVTSCRMSVVEREWYDDDACGDSCESHFPFSAVTAALTSFSLSLHDSRARGVSFVDDDGERCRSWNHRWGW